MAWYMPQPKNQPPSKINLVINIGDRAAHSCDKVGNNLYIFGGWNGKQALNDLYILDIENLLWTQPEAEGNIPA